MNRARGVSVAIVLLQVACTSTDDRRTPPEPTDGLVGTWRVIAHHQRTDNDSTASIPLQGYLVYDPTGHVFVQVMQRSTADSLGIRRWYEVPDTILRKMLRGFRAYFGTYHVDQTAHMVTHRIEGEFLPRSGQAEVATPYVLRGDTLRLGADSSERWIFVRVPQ